MQDLFVASQRLWLGDRHGRSATEPGCRGALAGTAGQSAALLLVLPWRWRSRAMKALVAPPAARCTAAAVGLTPTPTGRALWHRIF